MRNFLAPHITYKNKKAVILVAFLHTRDDSF